MISLLVYIPLCVYCILDYFHTIAVVNYGLEEINPIVLWIIGGDHNWHNLLYTKIFFLAVLGVLLVVRAIGKEVMTRELGRPS